MPNAIMTGPRRLMAAHPDVVVVITSGAVGGLLATAVQAFLRSDGNLVAFDFPELSFAEYVWFAVFGSIAAAVSVYLAANSRLDDLKRLCFFCLVCGITFPAILLSTIDPTAKTSQKQIAAGASIAKDATQPVADRVAAAEGLAKTGLANSPANEVDSMTRANITKDTSEIIQTLESQNSSAAKEAATNIFVAARNAGYLEVQR